MGFFKRKPSITNIFAPDGTVHPVHTAGNVSTDLSTGTTYFHAGNTITGTDGSFMTVAGNDSNGIVFGPDGGAHPFFGTDSTKTIL